MDDFLSIKLKDSFHMCSYCALVLFQIYKQVYVIFKLNLLIELHTLYVLILEIHSWNTPHLSILSQDKMSLEMSLAAFWMF